MQDTLLSDSQAVKFLFLGFSASIRHITRMNHVACLQIGLDFINTVYVNHCDTKTYSNHTGRDEGVNYSNAKDLVDLGDREDVFG